MDDNRNEIKSILGTLRINSLNENLFITIGYCEFENILMEQTIAIAERTVHDTLQKIIMVWKANSITGKIEKIEDLKVLICLNQS